MLNTAQTECTCGASVEAASSAVDRSGRDHAASDNARVKTANASGVHTNTATHWTSVDGGNSGTAVHGRSVGGLAVDGNGDGHDFNNRYRHALDDRDGFQDFDRNRHHNRHLDLLRRTVDGHFAGNLLDDRRALNGRTVHRGSLDRRSGDRNWNTDEDFDRDHFLDWDGVRFREELRNSLHHREESWDLLNHRDGNGEWDWEFLNNAHLTHHRLLDGHRHVHRDLHRDRHCDLDRVCHLHWLLDDHLHRDADLVWHLDRYLNWDTHGNLNGVANGNWLRNGHGNANGNRDGNGTRDVHGDDLFHGHRHGYLHRNSHRNGNVHVVWNVDLDGVRLRV